MSHYCKKAISYYRMAMAAVLAFSILTTTRTTADAAEDAKGIYLLGQKASMAGALPPPGKYGQSIKYYYSGDAGGAVANSITLNQIGPINRNLNIQADADVDVQLFFEVPVLLWITPHKILGAPLAWVCLCP